MAFGTRQTGGEREDLSERREHEEIVVTEDEELEERQQSQSSRTAQIEAMRRSSRSTEGEGGDGSEVTSNQVESPVQSSLHRLPHVCFSV